MQNSYEDGARPHIGIDNAAYGNKLGQIGLVDFE